jgi:3-oxosteroid 1-dehydrogenase
VTSKEAFDLVCVGSGGGGLIAALRAADLGLRPVILEKQKLVGGSTGMSGGIVWIPNNPMMQEEGIPDSYQDGLDYLQAVVGDPDEGSSMARREAFLTYGPEMVSFLRRKGVHLIRTDGFPDYYDNRKGGNARGRSVEGSPWDGKQLGPWYGKIVSGQARSLGLSVRSIELIQMPYFLRSTRSFRIATRVMVRTYLSRLRGQDIWVKGMSLVGQLTKILTDSGIELWLNTQVEELIVEGERVVGVRANRDGRQMTVVGNRGVLLAAGGFEHNPEMRLNYTKATRPNDGRWSHANPGNTGEVLAAAIALGAKTDYMDEAIWQTVPSPGAPPTSLAAARQWPNTILVNQRGQRFVNESNSYVEVGRAMYANDAMPAWLIFDDRYRRRIPWTWGLSRLRSLLRTLPGRMPKELVEGGWVKKADTIEELACLLNLDPETLTATVRTFNEGARTGDDPQFGRGQSQYNKALGDRTNTPNPCLGPLETAPFYAVQVFAGDVGTAGGVITDEFARVLNHEDKAIPGLYATGNMTATVMGRTYPGPGASIANTTVFGYIAAGHAAGAIGAPSGDDSSASYPNPAGRSGAEGHP